MKRCWIRRGWSEFDFFFYIVLLMWWVFEVFFLILNSVKEMKYLEKIGGGFMIMDKLIYCVINFRWRNGMGDGGRCFMWWGSVDFGLNGINYVNMYFLKEKIFCEKKVINDIKKCLFYMICKKDSRLESVLNNKIFIFLEKILFLKIWFCYLELRFILKFGCNLGFFEGELLFCVKDK